MLPSLLTFLVHVIIMCIYSLNTFIKATLEYLAVNCNVCFTYVLVSVDCCLKYGFQFCSLHTKWFFNWILDFMRHMFSKLWNLSCSCGEPLCCVKRQFHFYLAIQLLGLYPKDPETPIQKKPRTPMFLAAQFTMETA